MRPLYDGQENHYKKMLDLQERLRKSEEERIRLETKFNLLVQESRNRHQSCINQLRLRYVEFLEEQRARDERNNKLLGTLDKVDSSLAMMTAKSERLNILRKQYEAYLLRAYGTHQRANGSVTADSGLESQNDREISPTPVFSKSVALIRKNSLAYATPDFSVLSRKTPDPELLPDNYKLSAIQRSATDIERELSDKFAQAAAVPSFYDEVKDELKNRLYIPSYFADPPKYTSTPKPTAEPDRFESLYRSDIPKYASTLNIDPPKLELGLKSYSVRPTTSTPGKYDLDRYLNKIKQTQAEAQEHISEPERSFDDADQEQNTSGDLLNVTLSDDGNPTAAVRSSPEDDAAVTKDARSRFRALLMRQAYATENGSRNKPIDRTRRSPISDKPRGDDDHAEEAIDKFRQSEIATREIGTPFTRPPTLSVDDAFAKLALLSEPRRSTQQKQSSLAVVEDAASKENDLEAAKEKERRLLAELDNDESDKNEEEENGDGIEDDYDDTVDIDTWMPDDAEQQVEEVHAQDDIRDRPRRKLESIEEVEQVDDEDEPADQAKPDEENRSEVAVPAADESSTSQRPDDVPLVESVNDAFQESNEDESKKASEAYDSNEQYVNQQYQQQQPDDGTQQQYEEQSYEQQQQGNEQQQYQYSEDPNQQYAYDANAQYPGYDGQQYTAAEYEEYMKQYQQQYQQYEGYETGQQVDGSGQAQYDPNQVYDYSQDPQAYGEGYSQDMNQAYDYDQQAYAEAYAAQSAELYGADGQAQESTGGEQAVDKVAEESSANQKEDSSSASAKESKPKESKKKKKDVIKSILDSDSESVIERNQSNTESDYDFN